MKQKREFFIPALTFLIISIVLSTLYLTIQCQSAAQNKERYRYIAANQSNIIRNHVDTVLARAYTLSALIIADDGDISSFEQTAEHIYQETLSHTGVTLKNIAVAPDGIVEDVYPIIGNERLIGFDFMDESKDGNAEAIAAYQKGELIITNPFELVQGGTGMAGRLPVFLSHDKTSIFWGLVTVTLDFNELMRAIHLESLSNMEINYKLWYEDENGEQISMENSKELPTDSVSYEFPIMNLTWHLDVSPMKGWNNYIEFLIVFAVIIGISLLIATQLMDKARIKRANEKLQRLAHLDALTSCYSRQYVNTILLNQRNGCWSDPSVKYSLAIIDIDYFKSINDSYGHEAGDRAIIAIAQVLEDNSKRANGDCVIRYGGDEFILLLNDVTRERFTKKLESIVRDTRNIRFPDYPDMRLTVSIGGEHYSTPEHSLYYGMVRRADEKLYLAKENGRNQFIL